jgi:hypothetical protein
VKSVPRLLLAAALAAAALAAVSSPAVAGTPWHFNHGHPAQRADRLGRYYASYRPWHGEYAYTQWGTPVAMVVPPNSKMHTSWSWGVAQTEMVPVYHQFFRDYPGDAGGAVYPFLPTPYWPSHTDQFGVYPVRGPW